MDLDALIERLKAMPQEGVPPVGFANPHSYRGYYADLAFEPAQNVSFGEMLKTATSAKGQTFTGYKGGQFVMRGWVDCYLAHYGEMGEAIGPVLLDYMELTASAPED